MGYGHYEKNHDVHPDDFDFITLPETNIAHENPMFPCKYHQNGGFSMAMLVSGRGI